MTTAAAMVAQADGRVDPAERARLLSYMRRSEIRHFGSPFALSLFDKCLRELETDPTRQRRALAGVLAGFDGTPWAWTILRAAEHVAGADGAVHASEAEAINTIRTTLNLPAGIPERYPACIIWHGRS